MTDNADSLESGLNEYQIQFIGSDMTIDGRLDEAAWEAAVDVGAFEFPWWEAGENGGFLRPKMVIKYFANPGNPDLQDLPMFGKWNRPSTVQNR